MNKLLLYIIFIDADICCHYNNEGVHGIFIGMLVMAIIHVQARHFDRTLNKINKFICIRLINTYQATHLMLNNTTLCKKSTNSKSVYRKLWTDFIPKMNKTSIFLTGLWDRRSHITTSLKISALFKIHEFNQLCHKTIRLRRRLIWSIYKPIKNANITIIKQRL